MRIPTGFDRDDVGQFGEVGHLCAHLKEWGVVNGWVCEVGAHDGVYASNSLAFRRAGWNAVLVESDPAMADKCRAINEPNTRVFGCKVGVEGEHTLDNILESACAPSGLDVLSIDIDGDDYHVWKSLKKFRPRFVIIEVRDQESGLPNDEYVHPIGEPLTKQVGRADQPPHFVTTTRLSMSRLANSMGYVPITGTRTNVIYARRDVVETKPLRLNLGGGCTSIPGYVILDALDGYTIDKLGEIPDGAIDTVYASHVLEHFPGCAVQDVLAEWTRILKPGGKMFISVPDVRTLMDLGMKNAAIPLTEYLYGGQTDENDFHKTGFDEAGLRWYLEKAGLFAIQRFKPFVQDNTQNPISLNLEAIKPANTGKMGDRVMVVGTVPRLIFSENRYCLIKACHSLGLPYIETGGAYFDQSMERALESAIESGKTYAISIDYDSVFKDHHIQRLVSLMDLYPQAGAIAAMQAMRGPDGKLLISRDPGDDINEADVSSDIFRVRSAHFGLTIFRTEVLKKMKKPWLHHIPDDKGGWGDGRIDADINFWRGLNAVSQAYVTPRVNVGHEQLMVSWVDSKWNVYHQHIDDWHKRGEPKQVRG